MMFLGCCSHFTHGGRGLPVELQGRGVECWPHVSIMQRAFQNPRTQAAPRPIKPELWESGVGISAPQTPKGVLACCEA